MKVSTCVARPASGTHWASRSNTMGPVRDSRDAVTRNLASSTLVVVPCAPHHPDDPRPSALRRNTTFQRVGTNVANAACSATFMTRPTPTAPASHTGSRSRPAFTEGKRDWEAYCHQLVRGPTRSYGASGRHQGHLGTDGRGSRSPLPLLEKVLRFQQSRQQLLRHPGVVALRSHSS
jgi:hypothetical protein